MAEAAQQSDDWRDIHPAETQTSPYAHGDDWHDIAPPASLDEFAGPKITETPLYKAGEAVQKFGRETFPVSEEERAAHPYASAIGRGVGSMIPAVAGALVAGPAGALAGATQMGMSSGADVFDDALSKGATEEQAAKAAGATGALSAAIGVLPLGAILAPIRQKLPGMAGWAVAKLTQAAVNGATFATVGEAQQWLTTEVEKAYYDPNAHYDPQLKDMLASFVVGGAFGTMHPLRRPGQEAPGRPAEVPPLEGEVLPPERGPTPSVAGREAPTIEGEAVGAPPAAEGRPEGLPPPARALPPPTEAAPEPPLQAYEALPQEQIRNPVTGTPEEKIAQLAKLTAENKPIIQGLMKDIDDQFGTRSQDNVKTDDNILAKSQRPSILAKKPWFGVEYVRDSYRFKTLMDSLFDVPDIVNMIKDRGINVVKSDVVKQFHPGELGWRISAFDLQMPNGQLVEYYLPVKEMEFAKDEGHEIFEKWRNLDLKKLTPDQITAYEQDIHRSRDIYQNAWNAYLARTGDDPSALRAALSKIEASPSGTIRNVPLNVSSAEKAIPGFHTPLTREAAQPELSTSTSPDSSRTTVATSSSSKDNISDASKYDNQGVDLPTRNSLDKKGVPYTVEDFHPNDIKANPARFQFRDAADERTGETEAHAIAPEKWKGQHTPLLVWRDNQGQAWIIDGHHRLAISKRLVKNNPDMRLKAVVLNEADLTAAAAKNFGKTRNEVRDTYRNLAKGILDPKLGARTLRYIRDLLDIEKTGFRLPDQTPQETYAPDLFGPSAGTPHRVTAADGRAIDVHPIVVEADRPITSQDPGYDSSLQPRQRARAASEAQVRNIATNLNPEMLGKSAEADRGAPIIGSDGMVESGNGRVLALRRAYEQNGAQAKAYRDWLAQQGVDVSKFRNPIMVRRRLTPLTPEQRRAFTVAANQPTTLAMSASERAMADARLIDTNSLNLIVNPDDLSRNRDFVRRFVGQLPQTEQGAMADAHGALSSEGATRIRNAVLAKAYGDASVLTRIAESTNDEIKSISNALVGAAPRWAKMRAGVESGTVRRDVDLTPDLIEAVKRTADIRAKGQNLNDYLAQQDAFDKLPDTVESFMRNFYDPKGRRAASAERIKDVLRFYADEASKVSADRGLDLGLVKVEPRDILSLAQKKGWPDGRQGRDAERGGVGAGPREPAGGAQAPGPFLTAGGEGFGGEGAEGDQGAEVRAQRPERVTGPSLPGFEPVGSAEVAKRRAGQPLRPRVEQQPVGGDLFGYQGSQQALPLEDFINAVRNGPQAGSVRGGAPQVPSERPTRPPRRATQVVKPDQLSLFGGEPSSGDRTRPDVPVPPQQGSQGPVAPSEGPSVTKPPDVSAGGGEARPDPPAVIAGQREAEQKIAQRSRSNYRITDDDRIGEGGLKTKARQNLDAIRVLKQIEDENREATPQEKAALAKYTGWGALAQPMFKEVYNRGWESERKELRALLNDEEYDAARASTPNAHYTSPDVIRGMWDAMGHLGFDGGMALEPSAGIGHFIGLVPDEIAPRTAWTGVELDSITGRIAKTLYGGTEMLVQGFEKLKRPSNYYDLAISNVPFGDYHLQEKPYGSHPIHNFFFVKSLDKVRPGGVVAFITSMHTMDAPRHAGFRRLMAKDSDLVGAVRLPGGDSGAFAQNAGTQVTTDILFLRKKVPGEAPFPGAKWDSLKEIQTPEGPHRINEYYADRPHMMLGEMRLLGSMYRDNEPVLIGEPTGLREKIAAAATKEMQPGAFLSRDTPPPPPVHATEIAPGTKEGAFFVQDGKLYQRRNGAGHEHPLPPDDHDRVARLIGMRDLYNELVGSQIAGHDPKERDAIRAKLRDAYDNFVDAYGPINKEIRTVTKRLTKEGEPVVLIRRPNFSLFDEDPDAYKVASIENYDADEDKAKRAAVQTKDVIRPPVEREIKTPADALVSSLNDIGRIDLNHIARSLGLETQEQAITALGDLIYQNPDGRQWETSDRYLSGEVVKKLEDARAIAAEDDSYKRNVAALEKVQPEPLRGSQITAQLGAPWVPEDIYKAFLESVGAEGVTVRQVPGSSKWTVDANWWSKDAQAKYGMPNIPDRTEVTPKTVADAAFNNRGITVSDRVGSGDDAKFIKNEKATEEARIKVDLLKEAFSGDPEKGIDGWWLGDPERVQRMEAIYNRTYNDTVPWRSDGSHLTFPGMNPDFAEAKHRKDAVWRIIKNGNTLVAHDVGGGKTATAIASGMEQKRLGLITKPAYVVPNNLLQQWKDEFWRVYPDANILVADKDEMSRDNRRALLAKVASNDWDGVLITHDAFTRIGISNEFRQQFVRDQLDDLSRVMRATEESEGKKSKTVKQLEKVKKKLQGRLEELMAEETKDPGTSFEESGIDFIYLDEAHYYKNLQFPTSMQNVKGLSSSASQRAEDMYMKIRYLEQKRPGRSAVFLTGTPVSNTMAEMWTMQRYLQMDELKKRNLDLFDNWASTFGRVVTNSELSADGRTFKDVASFSRFVNMPELMSLYSRVADTKTAEQMALKLPTAKTHIVKAQSSPEEDSFIQGLVRYAEDMKEKRVKVKPGEAGQVNMASISTAGRKVATDGRLVGNTLTDRTIRDRENLGHGTFDFNPLGKIAKATDNIYRIWQEGNEDITSATASRAHSVEGLEGDLPGPPKVNPFGMAQLVFLDLGSPKKGKGRRAEPEEGADPSEEEHFNADLYADLKKRLVARGIPAHQIAAIHDAPNDIAKGKQFAKVNNGDIRIYMGSTQKLGVGANVQRRLVAMHDLDAPWRPADVKQRNGRGIRQGNLNDNVDIYRYVTERSFDAFMWQTLERKAKFLGDLMSGARGSRIVEDIDSPLPDAAQMKAAASGDPRILEHAELSRTVRTLAAQQRAHEQIKSQAQWQLNNNKSQLDVYEKQLPAIQNDAGRVQDLSGDKFVVELGGKTFTKRAEAGAAILTKLREIDPRTFYSPKVIKLGTMGGFDMNIEVGAGWSSEGTHLKATPILTGESGYASVNDTVINEHTDAGGLIRRFENILTGIRDKPDVLKNEIAHLQTEAENLSKTAAATWSKEREYRDQQKKLQDLTNELKGGKPVKAEGEEEEPPPQRSRSQEEDVPPQREASRVPTGEAEGRSEPQGQKIRIGRDTYAYVNQKYSAKEQEIANAVMEIGARMAPKANIKGVAALRMSGSPIWGGFINSAAFPQLITWSLEKGGAGQIGQTVRHEIIHHLRNMGLFSSDEWKALRDAAVHDGWLQRHNIYERYPDLSADHKVEEAVAEQFGKWRAERSLVKPGPIRDAFMRLELFLRRVAAAARKVLGFNATPADIFTRIETGEVGRREPMKRASGGRVDTRKASHYAPKRGTDARHCSNCTMFRKPHACSAVSGFIAERGLCDWYEGGTEKAESYAEWRERIGWANGGRVERANGGRVMSHYIDQDATEAQKKAGNYRKAHISVHGLDIAIENAKGHERSGVGKDGKPWFVTMPAHYGYIKRTEGADGDHVDCYVGPHIQSRKVFVIDQHDADTKSFDEHKCMLGFASEKQACDTYHRGFSDGRGKERLGHLTEMSIDRFKHWLAGDTESPVKGTQHAPKVDTSHDCAWMSEMSKDGEVFYRDRSLPSRIINNSKWLPIDEPLKRHEVAEYNAIKKMIAEFEQKHGRKPNDAEREAIYLKCHKEHGEVAEHAYLRENGYDVKAWESWCRGKLAHLEHKRIAKPVPNPHVRPSPHDRRRLEATL